MAENFGIEVGGEGFESYYSTTTNLKIAIDDLEQGKIDQELLKIEVKLAKDPAHYTVINPLKKIGMPIGEGQ